MILDIVATASLDREAQKEHAGLFRYDGDGFMPRTVAGPVRQHRKN